MPRQNSIQYSAKRCNCKERTCREFVWFTRMYRKDTIFLRIADRAISLTDWNWNSARVRICLRCLARPRCPFEGACNCSRFGWGRILGYTCSVSPDRVARVNRLPHQAGTASRRSLLARCLRKRAHALLDGYVIY